MHGIAKKDVLVADSLPTMHPKSAARCTSSHRIHATLAMRPQALPMLHLNPHTWLISTSTSLSSLTFLRMLQ
jgi:hypothetical protein